MDVIAGIDGTGPVFGYGADFKNSIVSKLCTQNSVGFPKSHYQRGPTVVGAITGDLAATARNWIIVQKAQAGLSKALFDGDGELRVFLAGYSRGGAACIAAAKELGILGIDVHCLILMDAVDRSPVNFVDEISGNVKNVIHARRAKSAGSREMFGNCGTKYHNVSYVAEKFFKCTHGGVGGTPWEKNGQSGFVEELSSSEEAAARNLVGDAWALRNKETKVTAKNDQAVSKDVWAWVNRKVREAKMGNITPEAGQNF